MYMIPLIDFQQLLQHKVTHSCHLGVPKNTVLGTSHFDPKRHKANVPITLQRDPGFKKRLFRNESKPVSHTMRPFLF